jgi:hypothetical protein
MEAHMRHALMGIGVAAAVVVGGAQPCIAVEQPRPWCLEGGPMHASMDDCSFYTIAQCKATGGNGAAACYPNKILLWQIQEEGRNPPVTKRPGPGRGRHSN